MRETKISYRFYNNYEGGAETLYIVEVRDNTKYPLQIFSSLVSLEEALKQAEDWRTLYEEGLIDEDDCL